eukprot:1085985-Lingulodinium_polyedra.AAC.1
MQRLFGTLRNALALHAAFSNTWDGVEIPEASECVCKASYVTQFVCNTWANGRTLIMVCARDYRMHAK